MKIETVNTDSFSMDYFRFGHGKESLVILPGLSVQSVMALSEDVARAYDLLTDVFTIYVFDRRKCVPTSYSMSAMAQDTREAIRKLGLDRVTILGMSQGGMIAMLLAIGKPQMVKDLVLCSTCAHITSTQFQVIENWIHLARARNAEGLYLAFGEALYSSEVFEQSRDYLINAANTVSEEDLDRFVIFAESIRDFDIADDLERITCPVLLIGSRDDKVLGPFASEQIASRLDKRNLEFYLYDGYGHAVYDTAPDIKQRILRFLISQ